MARVRKKQKFHIKHHGVSREVTSLQAHHSTRRQRLWNDSTETWSHQEHRAAWGRSNHEWNGCLSRWEWRVREFRGFCVSLNVSGYLVWREDEMKPLCFLLKPFAMTDVLLIFKTLNSSNKHFFSCFLVRPNWVFNKQSARQVSVWWIVAGWESDIAYYAVMLN